MRERDAIFKELGYADFVRLGRVTRARVTQIMNLRQLAPDIQSRILFGTCDEVIWRMGLKDLHALAAIPLWDRQRGIFQKRAADVGPRCQHAPLWCKVVKH